MRGVITVLILMITCAANTMANAEETSYRNLSEAMRTAVITKPFSRSGANVVISNPKAMSMIDLTADEVKNVKATVDPTDLVMLGISQRLLGKVVADATSVYSTTLLAVTKLKLEETTNIFDNKSIRENYDKYSSWTNSIGGILLAASAFLITNNDKGAAKITAGTGGVALISIPILKLLNIDDDKVAKQTLDETKRSSEILEQTSLARRAYDDIKLDRAFLISYQEKAKERVSILHDLDLESSRMYDNLIDGKDVEPKEIVSFIDKMIKYTSDYELLSKFYSEYLDNISNRVAYYQEAYPSLKPKLTDARSEIEGAQKEFNQKIMPFFTEIPAITQRLVKWRAQH